MSPTGGAPSPLAPLRPTARLLAVPGALALLFAALVGLRLHGFSLAQWNVLLGEPAQIEVWLGEPRAIRADDYAVILPLALAQEAHDPPFPVVNRLVGTGQNALLPFSLPVAHPLVLLRPDSWGFFLGADVGLAWRWWSRTFGLFLVAWALLRVVTRGDGALAAFGALALVASPFVQLWTLRPAPVAIHTGLLVLAALGVLFARRAGAILLSGLLLGYAAAGFALVLYPPFQVPLASVALLLAATLAWEHRDALDLRARAGLRLLALGAAGAVVGLAATAFWATAGDAVTRMLATAYPGRRVALGGGARGRSSPPPTWGCRSWSRTTGRCSTPARRPRSGCSRPCCWRPCCGAPRGAAGGPAPSRAGSRWVSRRWRCTRRPGSPAGSCAPPAGRSCRARAR